MRSRAIRRPSRHVRHGLLRAGLLTVAVLVGSACQLRTDLNITVEPDGSGEITVAIGLDEDGVAEHPDLLDELEFGDLRVTGWEVSGPEKDDDGFTRVRIRHEFGAPEEVATLLDEVAGESGPLRDFSLAQKDGFAETRYRFEGVVDFTDGVEGLVEDPELAEALDAEPVDLIQERLEGAIDQVLRFQVAVQLPGDVASNAPTQATNGAVWRPSVLEEEAVELVATSTLQRNDRIVWLIVAAVAGFALLLFVIIRVVLWRRARTVIPGS